MEIVASYDPPSTFTLSPPSYRAASPLSLTCEVQGLDDYTGLLMIGAALSVLGTVFSKLGTSKTVSTDYLHSYDTGVHTCMVYDTLGCEANASISIKVVGKAIIIVHVISSASPPLVQLLPQPLLFSFLSNSPASTPPLLEVQQCECYTSRFFSSLQGDLVPIGC